MRYSIKTKLSAGFGFLFLVILLLGIVGSVYIFRLSNGSDAMLKDNYKSVVAAKYMAQTLDEIKILQTKIFFSKDTLIDDSLYAEKQKLFRKNLNVEENNITESGEKELVSQLNAAYRNYLSVFDRACRIRKSDPRVYFSDFIPAYTEVKSYVTQISETNMNAIVRKNEQMKASAHKAFAFISILCTFCFIISFTFMVNFPGNISGPIRELTTGIKEIAKKNYNQQLLFESHDEFGDIAQAFNAMVRKLNDYEKSNLSKLMFEKKRIETIISNMKDAIIGLNEKKEIIFANPQACSILELNPSEIIGQYAPDVATQNDLLQNIVRDMMNSSYKLREFKPIRIKYEGKESYFTRDIIDVVTTREEETPDLLIGYVIILKNITQYQEKDEAKTNFIATISHELKTPISSARLNLKLLEDQRIGDLNPEQQKLVQAIRSEMNRLLNITGELLDIAQVESGNIQLNVQPVSPAQIVEIAFDAMKSLSELKNISMQYSIQREVALINADVEKASWVLINLINNAIQYSPEGGNIKVDVHEEENEVCFSVKDFGKGIEAQYLEKIFERFFKTPGSVKYGTGLGLAISKEFISKQKGRIWAESIPGEGSTFHFSLPVYKQ